jgi:apolipoprotein N-acyltransferase
MEKKRVIETTMPLPTIAPHHAAPVAPAGPRFALRQALLAIVSAVLMWASFFPLNLGWCAWFALVPLLLLVRAQTSHRWLLLFAWLGGVLHYFPSLQWIRVAHPMMYYSWIGLALYCSLYFPLSIWLLRRLDRFAPMVITVPVVWTALEFLRAHFLTGFAWYFLGHTQHDNLTVIQIADLGGTYAVSFVVAAVNGLLAEVLACWAPLRAWLRLKESPRRPSALAMQAGFAVLLVGGSAAYGIWQLHSHEFAAGPRVTILQSNLDQDTRNAKGDAGPTGETASHRMLGQMASLTEVARREQPGSDLMIWPETTCPYDWIEIDPAVAPAALPEAAWELQADRREMAAAIARESRTNVLIGINGRGYFPNDRSERYNSALLVTTGGHVRGRYDKIHCVPFGEYVPMRHTLPWMRVFTPYDHDYSLTPGERLTRFELPASSGPYHFGVLICYEDSDTVLARSYVGGDQPPVDFLVDISNDGWFRGSEEHEEHLAISRFRAVEVRRALVRSVNMGISAVIDGSGRVVALPGPSWSESKNIDPRAFSATVPLDRRTSLYARFGDWLPTGCAGILALGLLGSYRRRGAAIEKDIDDARLTP